MLIALSLLAGCIAEEELPPHIPRFQDLSFTADSYIDILDRNASLDGAVEETTGGSPIDLAGANEAFMLSITSAEIQAIDDAVDPVDEDYSSVVTGAGAALAVDLTLLARLGAMRNTMSTLKDIAVNENGAYAWTGSRAVTNDEGYTVTAEFNQHWLGTGWLFEVLQTSDTGLYDGEVWFNGFYAADGSYGWVDYYRSGTVMITMEWMGDRGDGVVELYWVVGDDEGDRIRYYWTADGELLAEWADVQPPPNDPSYTQAQVEFDMSGYAVVPGYNSSSAVCWGPDLKNVDC